MDLSSRVERLISPAIEAMGFEIVRIQLLGKEKRILRIMAERRDGGAMLVDDCAEISRAVSAVLDVEDSISGTYALEVSSPGIDRPLVRIGDFERFAGYEAKVEMDRLIDGRKRFKGRLLGVEGETVRMKMAEGAVELPFQDIRRAKLVLTDELIAAPEKK